MEGYLGGWPANWLAGHCLAGWLARWLDIGWLASSLAAWLVGWTLPGWLAGELAGCLAGWTQLHSLRQEARQTPEWGSRKSFAKLTSKNPSR